MPKTNNFSIIKDGIPLLVLLFSSVVISSTLAYLFESYFFFGLLVYIPLYLFDRKQSVSKVINDSI